MKGEANIAPDRNQSLWFQTLTDAERRELDALDAAAPFDSADVVIVGGGLIGLAAGYFAALRGLRVQVLEAGGLCGGASGANAGGVCPNVGATLLPPAYLPLARTGRDLWGRLSVRPGFSFDWRVNGFLAIDPEHWRPSLREFLAEAHERGLTLHEIDGEQVRRLEPQLAGDVDVAIHYPSEATLHPVKAALSFARAIRGGGGRVTTGVRVEGLDVQGTQVVEARTVRGAIRGQHFIAATGWESDWLRDLLQEALPLRPCGGQFIATDPVAPLLGRPVAGRYLMFQLRSGEVVTGGNLVEEALSAADPEVTREMAESARRLVPALAGVAFPHAWCGNRPTTPDGLPIVDRVPGVDNLTVVCGHYKKGVLLAPVCGELVARWVAEGTRPMELEALSWGRFG